MPKFVNGAVRLHERELDKIREAIELWRTLSRNYPQADNYESALEASEKALEEYRGASNS